jgi:O-antigen/teichoic acid export membrane protein
MKANFYGVNAVRRSLRHFLVGKVLNGAMTLASLMLLVRMLTPEEYGAYVVLTGFFEFLHTGSNLGIFSAAHRYIPEFRVRGDARGLYVLSCRLLIFRVITLVAASLLLMACGDPVSRWVDMPVLKSVLGVFSLVLIFEGLARFTDVLFESLLLQGRVQMVVFFRNGLRFLGLVAFKSGLLAGIGFGLKDWVGIDAAAGILGAVVSVSVYISHVRVGAGLVPDGPQVDYGRMLKYSVPAYLAQIVSLANGADMVKFLVAHLASAIRVGVFGFAAALNAMMERYMPAFLLIGMIRPLFISARENGRSNEEMVGYSTLIIKMNFFVIIPIIALLIVMGNPIADWLSGGKFHDAGPFMVLMAMFLSARVTGQALQLLLLVTEQGRAGLLGSCVALLGVAGGIAASQVFGVIALCGGLIASEVLVTVVAHLALRQRQMMVHYDIYSIGKMLLGGVVSATAIMFQQRLVPSVGGHGIVESALISAIVFLVVCLVLRPFRAQERALINGALPVPLFQW